jgi:hypothetical protein
MRISLSAIVMLCSWVCAQQVELYDDYIPIVTGDVHANLYKHVPDNLFEDFRKTSKHCFLFRDEDTLYAMLHKYADTYEKVIWRMEELRAYQAMYMVRAGCRVGFTKEAEAKSAIGRKLVAFWRLIDTVRCNSCEGEKDSWKLDIVWGPFEVQTVKYAAEVNYGRPALDFVLLSPSTNDQSEAVSRIESEMDKDLVPLSYSLPKIEVLAKPRRRSKDRRE